MATPPKPPKGTATPPRRKAADRKATRASAPKVPKTPKTPAASEVDEAMPAAAPAPTAPPPPKTPKPPKPRAPSKPRPVAAKKVPEPRDISSDDTHEPSSDDRETSGKRRYLKPVLGGIAALGAAVAGVVLASRKGPSADAAPAAPMGGAHQADRTDSSKSFEAGIADEGTIPEAL